MAVSKPVIYPVLLEEETNFLRLANLVIRVAPRAVRCLFDKYFNPGGLQITLNLNKNKIEGLNKKRIIFQAQLDILYPKTGAVKSSDMDLTLMLCLLRSLQKIKIQDALPNTGDCSEEADLSRIKYYRNWIAHTNEGTIDSSKFKVVWETVSGAIQRLGPPSMTDECNILLVTELDSSYKDVYLNFKNTEEKLAKVEDKMNILSDGFDLLQDELNDPVPKSVREQMKRQIDVWKINDQKYVSTKASDHVLECVRENSCVTVTASSGAGKTATVRHTALILHQEGYNIILITVPTDIRDYYQPGKPTVFIIDDMCGNFIANQQIIQTWKQVLEVVKTIMADKCCKIILSCRLQVYKDKAFSILSPFKSCECNLISAELYLSCDEKKAIAKSHIGENADKINKISEKCDLFPLLCYLCGEEKVVNVTDFFENPFEIYKKELDNLCYHGDEGKYNICALALCVIFNNKLPEKYLTSKVKGFKEILEDVCEACELNCGTSKTKVKSALDTLQQTFVTLHEGEYHTLHAKLFDFLAHYYGGKMITCLIEHADGDFIRERFMLKTSMGEKSNNTEFIIILPDDNLQSYIERLVSDWTGGSVMCVFFNNNFKNLKFRKLFRDYVSQLDKQQREDLMGKTDTVATHSDIFGASSFLCVCYFGYMDLMQWMLDNNADINKCTNSGKTPMFAACYNGQFKVVCKLLELNIDINQCDNDGKSPLIAACESGNLEMVCKLLESHVDINKCDNNGRSSLWTACFHGHLGLVCKLIESNVDINKCDSNGSSPLWTSCWQGHLELVCKLLESNVDINKCDSNGSSPLIAACDGGNLGVVCKLLELNVDIKQYSNTGWSPLLAACLKGHMGVVCKLLEVNADINQCDNEGRSPLMAACRGGNLAVVCKLLELNADIKQCDNIGSSPLIAACRSGNLGVVCKLLELNVDIHKCDNGGRSPLWIACCEGHLEVVCKLLDVFVDTTQYDNDGRSPLWIACAKGHLEVVCKLLELNVDIKQCDNNGRSLLIAACRGGNLGVVCKLLELNADRKKCDNIGSSPLIAACRSGNLEIVCKLLELNVDIN